MVDKESGLFLFYLKEELHTVQKERGKLNIKRNSNGHWRINGLGQGKKDRRNAKTRTVNRENCLIREGGPEDDIEKKIKRGTKKS